MTDEELNELENIAKKATQGIWEKGGLFGSINCGKRHIAMINFFDTWDEEQRVTREQTNANQEYFISFNPQAALLLIKELRQEKKERDWLARMVNHDGFMSCPHGKNNYYGKNNSCKSMPCKDCWIKAAKEATCQKD